MNLLEWLLSLLGTPYPWIVLSLVLLVATQKLALENLLTAAFLAVEKALRGVITAEGPEKMREAILEVVDKLPVALKTALTFLATLSGKTLDEFIADLAQKLYDRVKSESPVWLRTLPKG